MEKRIGRYEILAELGRGGFGHVYRALDPTVGRNVAIKTLVADGEAGMLTRFRNEAAASGRLRHPNIVTIFDFGEQDKVPYIVMELLEGKDLQHTIDERTPLSVLQKIQIMAHIASGLRHAHTHNIIHRDVKPANVMLLNDNSVKIMDFGIALVTKSTHSRLTPRGAMIGTFRYMAPEQFRGGEPDERTDIFSYGLVFYELLAGVHPFHAPDAAALMYNILSVEPVPIQQLVPDCPKELHPVVARLLTKDPDQRYQTLDDVLFDLEPALIALRRERAGELVGAARVCLAENKLEDARDLIRQTLELAPDYEGARELRAEIQKELRRESLKPRVKEFVDQGRLALEAGKAEEALERFESALRLDPTSTDLTALVQEAKSALEKSREATRLVQEARGAARGGNHAGAARLARQALELAPGHHEASNVLQQSEAALEEERRKARLTDELARAQRLIEIRSWEEVLGLLEKLRQEFPGVAEIGALTTQARNGKTEEERQRFLDNGLAAAREQFRQGDAPGALARLEQLEGWFPESREVENVLRAVRQELEAQRHRDIVKRSLDEARSAAGRNDYDVALRVLDVGLSRYPSDPDLQRERRGLVAQQREAQRRAQVEQTAAKASALRTASKFAEALAALEAYTSVHGDEAVLASLREGILADQETARRAAVLRSFVMKANDLLAHGKVEEATRILAKPPSGLTGNPEITKLLGEAESELRRQRARKKSLDEALQAAKEFAKEGRFDEARAALDTFESWHNADPLVAQARVEIEKSREHAERIQREAERARQEAEAAERARREAELRARQEEERRAREAEAARVAAERARQEAELLARLEEEKRAREAEAARVEAELRARQAEERRVREAEAGRVAAERARQEAELLARLEEEKKAREAEAARVEKERREREAAEKRARDAEAARIAAEQARQEAELLARLEEEKHAREAEAARLEAELRKQQEAERLKREAELRRKQEEERARREAEEARAAEARKLEAEERARQEAERLRREAEIRQQQEEAARQAQRAADELAAHARSFLPHDPKGALAVLEGAAADLRKRPEIHALEQSAHRTLEENRVRQAVTEFLRKAQEMRSAKDFAGAIGILNGGLKQFPAHPELAKALAELTAAKKAADRERIHRETIAAVKPLLEAHRFEEAAIAVAGVLVSDPDDEILQRLRTEIESQRARWNAERTEQELRDTVARARERIAVDAAAAVQELQALSNAHPSRPDVAQALSEAREAAALQARRRVIDEADALVARDDFAAARAHLLQFRGPDPENSIAATRDRVETRWSAAMAALAAAAMEAAAKDPAAVDLKLRPTLKSLESCPDEMRRRPEIQQAIAGCKAAITEARRAAAVTEIHALIGQGKISKARSHHKDAVKAFGSDVTLDAALAAIEEAARAKKPAPKPHIPAQPQGEPEPKSHATLLIAVAILALIGIGFGVWKWTRPTVDDASVVSPIEPGTPPQQVPTPPKQTEPKKNPPATQEKNKQGGKETARPVDTKEGNKEPTGTKQPRPFTPPEQTKDGGKQVAVAIPPPSVDVVPQGGGAVPGGGGATPVLPGGPALPAPPKIDGVAPSLDANLIRKTLADFGAAFSAKDVNRVMELWPTNPSNRALREGFREPRYSVTYTLEPRGAPVITGDRAAIPAFRTIKTTMAPAKPETVGPVPLTVSLQKSGAGWVITGMQ